MNTLTALLAISALSPVSYANPIPGHRGGSRKGFTITQSIPKPFQAGSVVLQRIYNKYNNAVPSDVATAAAAAVARVAAAKDNGTVPAIPEDHDGAYLSPITIGGQTMNVDFDTGSADLWVFSSELSASTRQGHEFYDPSKSETAEALDGYTWDITYGDGSAASGIVYRDTVEAGGVTVTGQAVELADQVSDMFQQDEKNDGLLGLAFSSINTVKPEQQTTFFDNAVQQGILSSNVFTADLKKGMPGTYDFGYIDSSKYTGEITYTSVNSENGFWAFTGTGYGVGNGTFKETSIDAIADTGTTLLLMDDAIVQDYYQQIKGAKYDRDQGAYVFPCSAAIPSLIIGIDTFKAEIPGNYMIFAPIDSAGNTCYGGLQSNEGFGASIYGDIFLKAVFAVFDSDNTQFGVAAKKL